MKILSIKSGFQIVSLSMFLTAGSFLLPSSSFAHLQCQQVHELRFGELRPDFQHNTHYTFEVPEQPEILDQCNFGTCHLHSWASDLEHEYKMNHSGQEIRLSMHYLTARLWLERSYEVLEKNDDSFAVDMGGMPSTSRDFILSVGVIPDSVWQGSRTFERGDSALRLQAYVQNIIMNAKFAIKTHESPSEKKEILEEAMKLIASIFDNLGARFPQSFVYEGKTYSPQSFATTFFPQLQKAVVDVIPNPMPNAKTELQINKDKGTYELGTSIEDAEKRVIEELRKGHDVFLGYNHDSTYVDLGTGIMSISAFSAPAYSQPLPLMMRSNIFKTDFQGHAVQIVGYDLDPQTGRVKKWKIKNSWGTKVGDKGYFHMYADYAAANVASYSFFKTDDMRFPAPKEEAAVPVEEAK